MATLVSGGAVLGGGGAGGGSSASPYPGSLDTTHDPVGLWLLDGDITDSSGNGLDLTAKGTASYYIKAGGREWYVLDGDQGLEDDSQAAALEITGSMTVQFTAMIMHSPLSAEYIVSHATTGETEDTNILYAVAPATNAGNTWTWVHEYSAGANENKSLSTTGVPNIDKILGQWHHWAFVRDVTANTITMYMDGAEMVSTPYTNEASGGTSGKFSIGRYAGGSFEVTRMAIGNVKIVDSALTAAQLRTEADLVI